MLSFKNFYHISWLLSLLEMDSDHLPLSSLWSSSDSFWLRSVTSRTCETGGLTCSENFIGKLKVRTYTLGVLVRIRNTFKLRLDLVHIPWWESHKTTTRLIFFFRSTVISITPDLQKRLCLFLAPFSFCWQKWLNLSFRRCLGFDKVFETSSIHY